MIMEMIFMPYVILINFLISLFPEGMNIPNWANSTILLLSKGLSIFPRDVWVAVLSNIAFWVSIQFIWAIIEWVYKKIPGIN